MHKANAFLRRLEMSEPKHDKPEGEDSSPVETKLNPKTRRRKKDEEGNDIKIKRHGLKKVNISKYQSESKEPSQDPLLQIEAMARIVDSRMHELSEKQSPMDEKLYQSLEKLARRMEKFRKVTEEEGYEDMVCEQPSPNQLMFFQDRFLKLTKPKLKHKEAEEAWVVQDYNSASSEDPAKKPSNRLPPLIFKP